MPHGRDLADPAAAPGTASAAQPWSRGLAAPAPPTSASSGRRELTRPTGRPARRTATAGAPCPVTAIMSPRTWETTCSWHGDTQVCDSDPVVSRPSNCGRMASRGAGRASGSAAGAGPDQETKVPDLPAAQRHSRRTRIASRSGPSTGTLRPLAPPHRPRGRWPGGGSRRTGPCRSGTAGLGYEVVKAYGSLCCPYFRVRYRVRAAIRTPITVQIV
jgi:hypothetical protein